MTRTQAFCCIALAVFLVGAAHWQARTPVDALAAPAASTHQRWHTAHVTSYATWEFGGLGLTGCDRGRGVCYTACGGTLNDAGYTVAANMLRCGTKILLADNQHRFHFATVTDRTGSSYDMELSYALSRLFGAPAQFGHDLTWSSNLRWRLA